MRSWGKQSALTTIGLLVGLSQGREWEVLSGMLFIGGHEFGPTDTNLDPDDEGDRETAEEVVQRRLLQRANKVVEQIGSRRIRSAPQLRVVTREVKAAQAMLGLVLDHLAVVHELAYDRVKAADRLKVMGGTHDYALDTNGDPKAREIYTQVAYETEDMIQLLSVAARELVTFMKGKDPVGIHRRRRRVGADCTVEDLLISLDAQQRRIARGESTPPQVAQPTLGRVPTLAEVTTELKHLRAAVAKTHPRLTRSERGRLTTLEQVAWRTAVPADTKAPKPPTASRSFVEQRHERGALPKPGAPDA